MPRKTMEKQANLRAYADEQLEVLSDIAEIINRSTLRDVVFLELAAHRLDPTEDAPAQISRSHQLLARQTETELHARIDSEIQSPEGSFRINALAVYEKQGRFLVSDDAQREFLERVGIFTIWPYLRAQLHQLCDGLSIERVPLPLIRQGEVSLTPSSPLENDNDDEARS